MEIEVGLATIQDKVGWESLYREYAEFYKVPMDKGMLDSVWSWIHNENEEFYCLVARDKTQKPVGFMHFRSMLSPLRGTKVGFLDDLNITPECRGSGVVEKLFKALDSHAIESKWPFVRWITANDNLRAQAVYNKLSERTKWVTYQFNAGKLV